MNQHENFGTGGRLLTLIMDFEFMLQTKEDGQTFIRFYSIIQADGLFALRENVDMGAVDSDDDVMSIDQALAQTALQFRTGGRMFKLQCHGSRAVSIIEVQ